MKQIVMKMSVSVITLLALANTASAMAEFTLSIKNHEFTPATVTIPANTKVKLIVKNLDSTPEEFESEKLHREKVIQGNSQAVIFIGPLKPGAYPFVGEFHESTAKGQIVVK